MGLIVFHGNSCGAPDAYKFLIISTVLYIIDRVCRTAQSIFSPLRLPVSVECVGTDVTRVELPRTSVQDFPFKPGQYMDLYCPQISKTEWHPFSMASSPRSSSFVFFIKNAGTSCHAFLISNALISKLSPLSGNWTGALYEKAKRNEPIHFKIAGPYSAPTTFAYAYSDIVVAASGVGVTPMLSVLKDIRDKQYKDRDAENSSMEADDDDTSERHDTDFHLHQRIAEGDGTNRVRRYNLAPTSCMGWVAAVCGSVTFNFMIVVFTIIAFTIFESALRLANTPTSHRYQSAFDPLNFESTTVFLSFLSIPSASLWVLVIGMIGLELAVSIFNLPPGEFLCRITTWIDIAVVVPLLLAHYYNIPVQIWTVIGILKIILLFVRLMIGCGGQMASAPYLQTSNMRLRSVHFIWINRSLEDVDWFVEEMNKITQHDTDKLFSFEIYLTRGKEEDLHKFRRWRHSFRIGRPDFQCIFAKLLSKRYHKSIRNDRAASKEVGVFFCGGNAVGRQIAASCNVVAAQAEEIYGLTSDGRQRIRFVVRQENF